MNTIMHVGYHQLIITIKTMNTIMHVGYHQLIIGVVEVAQRQHPEQVTREVLGRQNGAYFVEQPFDSFHGHVANVDAEVRRSLVQQETGKLFGFASNLRSVVVLSYAVVTISVYLYVTVLLVNYNIFVFSLSFAGSEISRYIHKNTYIYICVHSRLLQI